MGFAETFPKGVGLVAVLLFPHQDKARMYAATLNCMPKTGSYTLTVESVENVRIRRFLNVTMCMRFHGFQAAWIHRKLFGFIMNKMFNNNNTETERRAKML